MLKFVIAGAALMFGLAASSAPVFAGPAADECVDCPVSPKYDSDEVVQKIRSNKSSLANEAPIDVRTTRTRAARSRDSDCADCAPRRKYDSQQVIKKVRNVDQFARHQHPDRGAVRHPRQGNQKPGHPSRTRRG